MSEQIPIKLIGLKEAIEELSKLQSEAEAQCKETCHFDCKHEDARFYLHCAESSRLALTAERDALSLVLRQGADAAVDLRTKYEALKLERDGLAQKLADSELAFAHANEVVGKLEADVATHQQHYVDLECLFEKCVSERDGLKATVERVSMSEKVMAAELQAMERRKDDQIAELNRTIERQSAPVSDRQLTEITIERVLRKWADADDNEGINEMSPAEVARKIAADLIASRTAPAKESL